MRVLSPSNLEDLPPPPYSSEDPHTSTSPTAGLELPSSTTAAADLPAFERNTTRLPIRTSLRGGYTRPIPPPEEPALSSAAAYFEERPCTGQYPNFVLRHQIILDSEVTREDLSFPQPVERYRARDVSDADWSTFVNYILPEHHLSPLDEATKHDDNKRRHRVAEVDTPERQEQIELVVGEWNSGFFGPRGIHVYPEFPTSAISGVSRAISAQPTSYGASISPQPLYPPIPDSFSNPPPPSMPCPPHMPYGIPIPPVPPVPYPQTFMQNGEPPAWNSQNIPIQQPHPTHQRSRSSSSSSSSSSIPSISTTDLEGTTAAGVSTSLNKFRASPATLAHLASSVRQLREDLRSQRRPLSKQERKQQSKEVKDQMKTQKKEIKREVKSAVKEVKAIKKEEKRLRGWRAGRRDGEVGTGPSSHSCRGEAHRPEAARQPSWREVVANATNLARQQSLDTSARAREASARGLQHGLDVSARAREQALDAHRRASETAAAATQRSVAVAADAQARARAQAAGAGLRAREAAARATGRTREAGRGRQQVGIVRVESFD